VYDVTDTNSTTMHKSSAQATAQKPTTTTNTSQ